MRKLFLILLSVFALTAFAQQKKVAVYVTGDNNGECKVLGDQLVSRFTKSGKYIAMERTASFLAMMKKDQDAVRAQLDDNELSALGKKIGVQLVCVAEISTVDVEKYISARLIDVKTAEVINTASTFSELKTNQQKIETAEQIADELLSSTIREQQQAAEIANLAYAATDRMLSEAFTKGYMVVGQLYVLTSYNYVKWEDTSVAASKCNIGGFSGWRLPTDHELKLIRNACNNYYRDRAKYPSVSQESMEQLNSLIEYSNGAGRYRYWTCNDGYVLEGDMYYQDKEGRNRLILVRDK